MLRAVSASEQIGEVSHVQMDVPPLQHGSGTPGNGLGHAIHVTMIVLGCEGEVF